MGADTTTERVCVFAPRSLSEDDRALALAACGCRECFGRFWPIVAPQALNIVGRRVGRDEDREDALQAAAMRLQRAIARNWRSVGVSGAHQRAILGSFTRTVIERSVAKFVAESSSDRRRVWDHALRLDAPGENGGEAPIAWLLGDDRRDPARIIEAREALRVVLSSADALTTNQRVALSDLVSGRDEASSWARHAVKQTLATAVRDGKPAQARPRRAPRVKRDVPNFAATHARACIICGESYQGSTHSHYCSKWCIYEARRKGIVAPTRIEVGAANRRRVAELTADGTSTRVIAGMLGISQQAVRGHVRAIRKAVQL